MEKKTILSASKIKTCRFTREGDFLITCGKDSTVNLWFSDNGERAGTFNGHNGAVWTTDMNCECSLLGHCVCL